MFLVSQRKKSIHLFRLGACWMLTCLVVAPLFGQKPRTRFDRLSFSEGMPSPLHYQTSDLKQILDTLSTACNRHGGNLDNDDDITAVVMRINTLRVSGFSIAPGFLLFYTF